MMLAAALSGRRNMVLFAIVAAPLAAENCRLLLGGRDAGWLRGAVVACGLAMLAFALLPERGTARAAAESRYRAFAMVSPPVGVGATPSYFPHRFPEFMKNVHLEGNVLNSSNIGGFFLYHFYPARLPLTDGRWEIYDPATMSLLESALTDPAAFREVVERYDIGALLLEHYSPEAKKLLPRLAGNPAWQLCYYDHAASFWVRSDRKGALPPADLSPAAPLAEPARVEDCMLLDLFLGTVGTPELRLRNLQRGMQFGSNRTFFLQKIGTLRLDMGNVQEAETAFAELLRLDPDNAVALNELSIIAYRRGDLATAEKLLRHAVEVYPDNEVFRKNYRLLTNGMRP
jgi:hypothetical protein